MPEDQAPRSSPSANRAELSGTVRAAPAHLWAVTLEFLSIPPSSSPILQGTAEKAGNSVQTANSMAEVTLKFPDYSNLQLSDKDADTIQ